MSATALEHDGIQGRPAAGDGLRRVHLGMIDAVLAGEGSDRVAALAAHELDGPVAIVLPAIDLAVIAPRGNERRLVDARRYVSDRLLGTAVDAPDGLVGEVAVTSGDERLGSVLLLGGQHRREADEILQLAALAAVTAATLEHGTRQTDARARLTLLEIVRETPPPHPSEIVARAKRLGCDLAHGASALCARITRADAEWALATIAQAFPHALAAQRGGHVEALLPGPRGLVQRLARRLSRRLATGLAPFEDDIAALGHALRFAELAMALGAHEGLEADELLRGSWRLLLGVAAHDPREIDALIDTTIGPALTPDVSQRADLLHTLRAYRDNDARMNATATAIHAHRHTVAYRLGRIAELTGHDPQTPAGLSQLTLGLQALALRAVTSTTA